ncbi:MAG: ankyrin repeat domain-containing protein [Alteromonadaceae bacterium]|nr:ankyrin repeat domain-containing protein [Alteromonadaceae bacterium]
MKILYLIIVLATSFNVFANVVVDLSKIEEGQYQFVNWHNLPVLIFHRTENQIEQLHLSANKTINQIPLEFYARRYGNDVANAIKKGEHFNRKQLRSFDGRWFVAIGSSPEVGVRLRVYGDESAIMDPMDGTFYDLTGRVVDKLSTKKDLSIPDYKISNQSLIIYTKPSVNDIDFSQGKVKPNDLPEKQIVDALNWKKFKLAGEILDNHPKAINDSEVNMTILVAATIYGDKELLEKALKYGADINILFKNNSTPLNTALMSNHMDIAKYLIDSGASTQKVCHPKHKNRCSTPTLEMAKMIEGTEGLIRKWIKNQ